MTLSANKKNIPIPVTVVTGFLGAGKTTLVNHVLQNNNGRRIAIVVNDFGSVNVDAELITAVDDEMISLTNGCVCCAIRMDLIGALLKLAGTMPRPEHIVIEASGVADPAGIVNTLLGTEIWDTIMLDGVVTLVDADQFLEVTDTEDDLAKAQVVGGDLIVLNKVDLAENEEQSQLKKWISSVNPSAEIIPAVQCRVPLELLLGTHTAGAAKEGFEIRKMEQVSQTVRHNTKSQTFKSWTFESPEPLNLTKFQALLSKLPRSVCRVKGFLYVAEKTGQRLLLQMVGRRATLSPIGQWGQETPSTRLVFIERGVMDNLSILKESLAQCCE